MGGVFRLALEGGADEIGDSGIVDLARSPGAGQIAETGQTLPAKTFPPITHSVFAHLKLGRDLPTGFAFGTGQNHSRPSYLRDASLACSGDFFQLAAFFLGEFNFSFRSSSKHDPRK